MTRIAIVATVVMATDGPLGTFVRMHMETGMIRFPIGLLIVSLTCSAVMPCCMLPAKYKGTISQNAHEAVIIHHGDREELVLRIDYKITG